MTHHCSDSKLNLEDALAKQALMGFDHGADGGFVFHPDRCTGTNHEEIPANPTELKGAPKLEPVCGLALIGAPIRRFMVMRFD